MDSTQYHDDRLQQLFSQLPVEGPPVGFPSQVMDQIMLEAQHAVRINRMHRMESIVITLCLLIIPAVTGFVARNYWTEDFLRFFDPLLTSLSNAFSSVAGLFAGRNGSEVILPGIVVLALLLGDLFLRRYAERKKQLI